MVNKKKDTHTAIYESDGATTTYGHTWNNKTVTKEPTTTDEGEKTFTCTNCGKTCILNRAILRIVINYTGTSFFTNNSDGYFQEHESLEKARDFLIERMEQMLRLRLKQVYDSAIEQKDNYFVKIMKQYGR